YLLLSFNQLDSPLNIRPTATAHLERRSLQY
ncbi:MAG: hypothetical protein ACI9LG_002816, partial [Moritella dasanensis]